MKALVVEDDFTSRILLQEILSAYGPVHVAVNGQEALDAVRAALNEDKPYDLICLDIMMPEMDGQEALKKIRDLEIRRGIYGLQGSKIVMTTSLSDPMNVMKAFTEQTDAYIVKPVDRAKLLNELRNMQLIE